MGQNIFTLERRTLFAALTLAFVVAFAMFTFARAQTNAKVAGQILNGTKAAAPGSVANLPVSLFQMGGGQPVTATTQTDANGNFTFANLDPQIPFFVEVEYAKIKYFTPAMTFTNQTSVPVSMTVYETATMPADLHISQMHLIMDVSPNALQVAQLVFVANSTDRVFLLPLAVPSEVKSVSFEDPRDQAALHTLPDGTNAFPVAPPGAQIIFGYALTAVPPDYALKVHLPYAVDTLSVLVQDVNGIKINSPQLAPGNPFDTQAGTRYVTAVGQNLPANATVSATISNLPGADTTPLAQTVVMVAGGIGALGLLGWALLQRRATPVDPNGDENATRRVELLRALAALDDAHDSDELDEDDYEEPRAELKAELIALMQRSDVSTLEPAAIEK